MGRDSTAPKVDIDSSRKYKLTQIVRDLCGEIKPKSFVDRKEAGVDIYLDGKPKDQKIKPEISIDYHSRFVLVTDPLGSFIAQNIIERYHANSVDGFQLERAYKMVGTF